jgi:alkane 1-monooxygenase
MSFRVFKYLSPWLLYFGVITAFLTQGFGVWLPLEYAWVIIPALEHLSKPGPTNLSEAEEELTKKTR